MSNSKEHFVDFGKAIIDSMVESPRLDDFFDSIDDSPTVKDTSNGTKISFEMMKMFNYDGLKPRHQRGPGKLVRYKVTLEEIPEENED